jgi:Zn-dependent protease
MSVSQCHYCERQVAGLPFRCNYCGNFFCPDHRLPENHACARIGGPRQPGYADVSSLRSRGKERRPQLGLPGINSGRSSIRMGYSGIFSKTEQQHITEAALLVVAVGLSLAWLLSPAKFFEPILLSSLIVGFLVSFFGHELAHKFLARRIGLWAEFRLNAYGVILTLISIIPFFFKFIMPGQTLIQGNTSSRLQARIALIGPAFNVGLGILCFLGAWILPGFNYVLGVLSIFNAYMAITNLIPFGGLDGTLAFWHDRESWAIVLGAGIALFIALIAYG